jgi:RNA polymerase sigma factor (sigma-70 family)
VLAHLGMVDTLAQQVFRLLTSAGQEGYNSRISLEDLVQCGRVGLLEAAERYRPTRGAFEAFAYRRVRGAMIDAHKRRDYRERLHTSVDEMQERLGYLPARYDVDPSPLPDAMTAELEQRRKLRGAIEKLPEAERQVLEARLAGEEAAAVARRAQRSATWVRGKLHSACQRVAAELRQTHDR